MTPSPREGVRSLRLGDLTPELFRHALRLYQGVAYPRGALPSRAQVELDELETPADVLALFTPEDRETQPGEEPLHHFALRLGNQLYPHMKLVLLEFVRDEEWVFAVDTHDRMPIDPESPEWEVWRELRMENLRVKAAVEAAWRAGGLDTARVVASRIYGPREDGAGPRILVVDDELGMRSVAVSLLRRGGYQVSEASSGLDALEQFVELRPDLVLLDFEMPGMDGGEVCDRLRELERVTGRRVPILMATAGPTDLSDVADLDAFLVKPYQPAVLLSFVKHQLPGEKEGLDSDA